MEAALNTYPPTDEVIYYRNTLEYKIGKFGFVMVRLNDEWVRSTTTKSELFKKPTKRVF